MAIIEYMDVADRFDRRIGRREDVEPLDAMWVDEARYGRRSGLTSMAVGVPGKVLNVSVTGAAVTAPPSLSVEVGSVAVVRCHGVDVPVAVRRRHGSLSCGSSVYGVEFLTV